MNCQKDTSGDRGRTLSRDALVGGGRGPGRRRLRPARPQRIVRSILAAGLFLHPPQGPLISLASPVAPYEDIAFRHGLSESAVKSTAQRLRQEFRTVVRALVAETVASDEEIDEEIRHLFTLFAS